MKWEVNALFIFKSRRLPINTRFIKDFETKKQVVFDTTESEKAVKMMNPEVIEELIVEGRMYAETWYGIQYALMKQKDGEMPFALYQERHPES